MDEQIAAGSVRAADDIVELPLTAAEANVDAEGHELATLLVTNDGRLSDTHTALVWGRPSARKTAARALGERLQESGFDAALCPLRERRLIGRRERWDEAEHEHAAQEQTEMIHDVSSFLRD